MTVSTSTILSQTLTDQSGNWSSGPLDAGTFTELTLDIKYSALSAYTIATLSRIDTFGNPVELWGAAADSSNLAPLAADIGPCDGYSASRAFGAKIQIDIVTTGTVSGTISLQGKG